MHEQHALHDGGDVAWGKGPVGGVDGVGTHPPLLPGECVPWPLDAASAPATAAAGGQYPIAGDAAAVAAAAAVVAG